MLKLLSKYPFEHKSYFTAFFFLVSSAKNVPPRRDSAVRNGATEIPRAGKWADLRPLKGNAPGSARREGEGAVTAGDSERRPKEWRAPTAFNLGGAESRVSSKVKSEGRENGILNSYDKVLAPSSSARLRESTR